MKAETEPGQPLPNVAEVSLRTPLVLEPDNEAEPPRGVSPEALSEPCVNLSTHTARLCCLPVKHTPMCEQGRVSDNTSVNPACGSPPTSTKAFPLSHGPQGKPPVDQPQRGNGHRLVEGAVVVRPPPDLRVKHPCKVVKALVAAKMQLSTPDFSPDRFSEIERSCCAAASFNACIIMHQCRDVLVLFVSFHLLDLISVHTLSGLPAARAPKSGRTVRRRED